MATTITPFLTESGLYIESGSDLRLFWRRQVAEPPGAQPTKDDGDGEHGEQQRRVRAGHEHTAPEVKALRVARERYDRLVGRQAQHGGAGQVERVGLPPRRRVGQRTGSACMPKEAPMLAG